MSNGVYLRYDGPGKSSGQKLRRAETNSNQNWPSSRIQSTEQQLPRVSSSTAFFVAPITSSAASFMVPIGFEEFSIPITCFGTFTIVLLPTTAFVRSLRCKRGRASKRAQDLEHACSLRINGTPLQVGLTLWLSEVGLLTVAGEQTHSQTVTVRQHVLPERLLNTLESYFAYQYSRIKQKCSRLASII